MKRLKNYHIKGNEEIKEPVLQVSNGTKIIYRMIRILFISIIITVIWNVSHLKTLRIEYYVYVIIINAWDAIALTIWVFYLWFVKFMRRTTLPRYVEESHNIYKFSVFYDDCTYETEKIIGKHIYYLYQYYILVNLTYTSYLRTVL